MLPGKWTIAYLSSICEYLLANVNEILTIFFSIIVYSTLNTDEDKYLKYENNSRKYKIVKSF